MMQTIHDMLLHLEQEDIILTGERHLCFRKLFNGDEVEISLKVTKDRKEMILGEHYFNSKNEICSL